MIETLIAIPSWCALADSVSRMSSLFAETAEKRAVVVVEDAYYLALGVALKACIHTYMHVSTVCIYARHCRCGGGDI